MSKFDDVYNWLRTCPSLNNLWAISADKIAWQDVLFLNNTEPLYKETTVQYRDGLTRVTLTPTDDYAETYTINAYRPYAENQDAFNLDAFAETQKACGWIIARQNAADMPVINGAEAYAVECLTPSPIIRGTDEDSRLIGYYISIKIHMQNPAKRCDYIV